LIIDAHCHVIVAEMMTSAVPAHWRPAISVEDGRQVVTFRGRELRSIVAEFTDTEVMASQAAAGGVDHLLLSPWIMLVPVEAGLAEATKVCRVQNEGLSRAAADGRVSALGAVPLQDAAAAAAELEYLMRLPGFELPALGDYYLWNSAGNPLETAITAAHLAATGVLERYPRLRILLAHGGGGLMSIRGRLRQAFAARPEARARSADGPDAALRRFYFDTVTHDRALLADLVGYAGADHLLLGSDRPFDMGSDQPAEEVRALRLSDFDERSILGGNASRLLDG
jgi:aminocarboxymuconate-semialdehyde decarboxylase